LTNICNSAPLATIPMLDFTLTIRRDGSSGSGSLRVTVTDGVSVGSSIDGSATAVILGEAECPQRAAALADRFVANGRSTADSTVTGIGAVVIDHARGAATAIAPRLAPRLLYWRADTDEFSIASEPHRLAHANGRVANVTANAVFQYVYFHMIPGPATAFAGISKLDGGHTLFWNGGPASVTRYWRPRFAADPAMSETAAALELHRLLRKSVERSLAGVSAPGAFLSGGLDSSTVAGLASQFRPGIPTVTMGFNAAGYDEIEYARIASRHFGTRPLEYYVTPDDVLRTLPTIAAAFPEPFGNSSAAAVYHCARMAREHGISLLLAGDGGDELFGGNDRYARQVVFENYARLPRTVRQSVLEPLIAAAARRTTALPVRKAQSYIEQALVPLPDRLQRYNFLHQLAPTDVFAPELMAQVDPQAPLRLLREEFSVPQTSSNVDRMLFMDWKFTLHDNDLVKVNVMADLAGVGVAYPMLADSVLDFSLEIPADWKVRRGQLRWFYKRAMRDFLPRAIIKKTKHGFGLPFGVWTRTHEGLRQLSEDALQSLSKRGYFRPGFLTEALRLHREGHASYYGELVWILLVLELWLQAHGPGARL
jgi:asparagine synthase (glutamine-hydrolysing)